MRAIRSFVACLVAFAVVGVFGHPAAQGPVPIDDRHLTYILPQFGGYLSVPDGEFAQQVQLLRTRIGEAPRVRVGFSAYVTVDMTSWTVDPGDPAAVTAALSGTIAAIDATVARGKAHGIPVAISFLAGIRERVDGAQTASQEEDRRNMQWHADNSLAAGWWTHTQYARRQRRVQEAYWRALGRAVANRMAADPRTFVAATGDGEIELSNEQVSSGLLADYSPLAVAEFRDWLRGSGLYAPGQPFGGQAYSQAARYRNDAAPDIDSSGDGHTINGDFGTAFLAWELKHFDWSLEDAVDADPYAIASAEYLSPGWNPLPAQVQRGFDAPRVLNRTDPWWTVWNTFRQQMVARHNRDVARWMTTSADPATGHTVPVERWYSHQIPADYIFGHTPAAPDPRLDSSASPWWSADVHPYGSTGITSFNTYNCSTGHVGRTLASVAPRIAATGRRWAIAEWNPVVPGPGCEGVRADPTIYRQDVDLIVEYRPSLIIPFMWDLPLQMPVLDTGFEVALRELVQRIGTTPLGLSRVMVNIGMTSDGAARTPPQVVRVAGDPGTSPPWTAVADSGIVRVERMPDERSFSVVAAAAALPPGEHTVQVTVSSIDPAYTPVVLPVVVRVTPRGASQPPIGSFDSPAENAEVSGEVAVTGWALDDIGISAVEIYRSPVGAEPAGALVPIGPATLVEGARPDVQQQGPTYPLNERAGWGYMLLTNMLPGGGDGLFTLWAAARDVDGNTTMLGSRRILARNSTSPRPFGTIDTPRQGETVSGVIDNFGWALTPRNNWIPVDGSTIAVFVDNVFVGRPTYNLFRSDIASLFPGYANSNGAVGHFRLDTTTLANGVHTIAWSVTDSAGNVQGVGSRYFTVNNP